MFLRSTTSLLTLGVFLVHAAWGCCAHHVHASEIQGSGVVDHADEAACSQSADTHAHCSHAIVHDHPVAGTQEPCGHHGEPDQRCDEQECFFDVPTTTKLSGNTIAATLDIVATAAAAFAPLERRRQAAPNYPSGAASSGDARPLLQTWLL